jgi:hypothetical protein
VLAAVLGRLHQGGLDLLHREVGVDLPQDRDGAGELTE